jgi:hypothetical protein
MLAALSMLLLAAVGSEQGAEKEPSKIDFVFAEARRVHELTGIGGMVHCPSAKSFRTRRVSQGVFEVSYRGVAPNGRLVKMKALLRRDGEDWVWIEGQLQRCSITIIEG